VTGLEGEVDGVRKAVEVEIPATLLQLEDAASISTDNKLAKARKYVDEFIEEVKVDLRGNADRVTGLEGEVDGVRAAIEVELPATLLQLENAASILTDNKLLELRKYVDELIAGLREYTSNVNNKVQQTVQNSKSIRDVMSTLTDDLNLNASEVEHVKRYVETFRSRLTDVETSMTTGELLNDALAVVNDSVAGLDKSLQNYRSEADEVSSRLDGVAHHTAQELSKLGDRFDRLVARVANQVNNDTEVRVLMSKFEALEGRVTQLVQSNIELERRLEPLLEFMRRTAYNI